MRNVVQTPIPGIKMFKPVSFFYLKNLRGRDNFLFLSYVNINSSSVMSRKFFSCLFLLFLIEMEVHSYCYLAFHEIIEILLVRFFFLI